MNAQQFVSHWLELKSELLEAFVGEQSTAEAATQLRRLGLTPEQNDQLRVAIDGILTDTMYTLLLGLDGAASIGTDQQPYTIADQEGNVISRGGELAEAAWSAFHGGAK